MAIPPPRSHANAATSAPRRCSNLPNTKRATVLDPAARDEVFMRHALLLANRARHAGEVPVGALVVRGDRIVGEGWNQPIGMRDPSAHAEMLAMRAAAQTLGNYRLRSEEHTSELQSLMRISYAVFCLKKKTQQ